MKSQTGRVTGRRRSPLRRRHPWLMVFACFVLGETRTLGSSTAAEQVPEGNAAGTPWVGPAGIQESVSDIMAREERRAALEAKPARIKPTFLHDVRLRKLPLDEAMFERAPGAQPG